MTGALTLSELAQLLGVDQRQRRLHGDQLISIAGSYGVARLSNAGDSIIIELRVSSHLHDDMRRRMAHAGLCSKLANGVFELLRLPADKPECTALAAMLGIGKVHL